MTGKRFCRSAAAVLAALLVIGAFVIQFLGGQGSIPDWKQIRTALGVPLQTEESAPQAVGGSTVVYVLDVGQGDAVLICQDNAYCLIDTGPAEAEDALLYDLAELGVYSLDYLVLTHPHADHTGNARAVLQNVSVQSLLLPQWEPTAEDTSDWPRHMMDIAADCGAEIITVEAGEQYPLGGGTLHILQDGSNAPGDANNGSLCTLFTAATFRFLDTGDAEAAAEQQLIDTYGTSLHATLFKAGHHGSYTANSLSFLEIVHPEAVAVSCGLDNEYGHPHRAALQNFAEAGAEIWRTDLQGSLTFTWQNNTLCVETTADSADVAA